MLVMENFARLLLERSPMIQIICTALQQVISKKGIWSTSRDIGFGGIEPVIVRDVLQRASGLSWEPMVMRRAFREVTYTSCSDLSVTAIDWREVDMNIHQFFKGYSDGRSHKDCWPEMLKLKDWPPIEFL